MLTTDDYISNTTSGRTDMNATTKILILVLFAFMSGCSATRCELNVSYSPAKDCELTARVFSR